ncbi:MAG: hypothetical protein D6755_09385 [Anaerolineae bacterium]|nr:MAG: hypothetical protein D6755_09385 [Anaerolineae bacterium]
MARAVTHEDDYFSRLLKYIPSEIIMAYISIEGVLRSTYRGNASLLETILWSVAGILLVLTPLWMYRVMGVRRASQLLLSTLSFAVWLFAMGGPFRALDWYQPALGGVVLPIYTLLVPIITGKRR